MLPPPGPAAPFRLLTAAPAPTPVPDAAATRRTLRLANTALTMAQLYQRDDAILLANALIDTRSQTPVPIPDHLRAQGDPGSYLVQSRGPLSDGFRQLLAAAGAQIISYIPNNAYLVRASAGAAQQIAAAAQTQRVLPYEPYYKLSSDLLKLAVQQRELLPDATLSLTLFTDLRDATVAELHQLGAEILREEPSPFGPVLTVQFVPTDSLSALARLPGVQGLEPSLPRLPANDLSRARMGASTDTVALTNYLLLTGLGTLTASNILVAMADSGVDSNHVDLAGRVIGDNALALVDTNGHGTHVAGIIASSGQHSPPGTNASGSVDGANFRGKASGAKIFSMSTASHGLGLTSDAYYQQTAARSNAFIANFSWDYGSSDYTISAASYDAAVRDALPALTGSQPLLCVFAAGNSGTGLQPGSILSPSTAKNVITVGALEQLRNITNQVHIPITDTNGIAIWESETDSDDQVADFSGRGNVGIGMEGPVGRFKPDVVAPGVFVVSCRSTQWDTDSYYSPTNYYPGGFVSQLVATNTYRRYSLYIPDNAVQFTIAVVPNRDSLKPFPPMPIFVRQGTFPEPTNSTYDFVATNDVSVPPDGGKSLVLGSWYYYSIGNVTNQTVNFDVSTMIVTTNDLGDSKQVLAGMNDKLGAYRYESGTSMSAAGVSGFLALMQQFLAEHLQLTNRSPALMKALLINGARSLGQGYRFPTHDTLNLQGWGLPYLPTTLPSAIGVNTKLSGANSMWLIDQNPTNALSTGWSQTRQIAVAPYAQGEPLRLTLVWTDPPGNPNASLKLVNNLDLIVTNLDTGAVYYGNDFGPDSDFTMPWPTNEPPRMDSVNNVENVYLPSPLGTNYTVTVIGRRVNVNALTTRTNEVAQDYALVMSCGDGFVTNALSLTESAVLSNALANVTFINSASNGYPLLDQIVGASSPLVGTNLLTNAISYGVISPGVTNQWTFYVITNTTVFTNAAFVTFLPPNLALPRMAVQSPDPGNQGRLEADIDLYVSTLPGLTNLDTTALTTADKSLNRGGTEWVVYSNSVSRQVYYIGVKSEDQMASTYGFVALFSELPFAQMGADGMTLKGVPVPIAIPDGSPQKPGGALVFCVNPFPMKVRRAVAEMNVTHDNFGDLFGNLSHSQQYAVLNNHTVGDGTTNQTLIYDDSGEGTVADSQTTDGPGSLRDFMGSEGVGVWMLTMVDNAQFNTGSVNNLTLTLQPQPDDGKGVTTTVQPSGWFYEVVDVPVGAIYLTVSLFGNQLPMNIYIRKGDFPTLTAYDKMSVIQPPGGFLSLTKYDAPPLSPGRYYIGIYNPSLALQTVTVTYHITRDLNTAVPTLYTSDKLQLIPDDAVSYASQLVTNQDRIAGVEVGLRIEHPRVSDLAVTLISPRGTRALLVENRGYGTTNGFGSDTLSTNIIPVDSTGGAAAYTNVVDTGLTSGSFTLAWDFYVIPDRLRVYYQGTNIFDTGMVGGTGTATVNYGPGTSTFVTITVNEGDNPNAGTAWQYTMTSTRRKYQYVVLTDNTNLTQTPIKFAQPPFGTKATSFSNLVTSGFEGIVATNYATNTVVDGWTVAAEPVTVVTDTNVAYAGSNYLALGDGTITRVVPTTVGRHYVLSLASRKTPGLAGLVSWWRGENDMADIVGGHNGRPVNGAVFSTGEVGLAFDLTKTTKAYVEVPDSDAWAFGTNDFSIELWANFRSWAASGDPWRPESIFVGNDEGGGVLNKWFFALHNGKLIFHVNGPLIGLQFLVKAPFVPVLNQWYHLAVTRNGNLFSIYVNGTLVGSQSFPVVIPNANAPLTIGQAEGIGYVDGRLDEVTIFNHALGLAEIQGIVAAGSAGKCGLSTPPSVCTLAGGLVSIDDITVASLAPTDTNWTVSTANFAANSTGTVVTVAATGAGSGLLLDSLTVKPDSENLYYLPEQSLDALIGESAYGEWTLELWDNRAGATNPPPKLVSWQLGFYFINTVPATAGLTHGQATTNTVPPGSMLTYEVQVPPWAKYATNSLTGDGPLNLLFNQFIAPTGSNDASVILLTNVSAGTAVLSASTQPPLISGETYYLGVQNTGTTSITFVIELDFDITALSNGLPVTSTVTTASLPRYFQFDVSSNATAVVFALTNLSGDANLYARRGPPLPTPAFYDFAGVNRGSDPESIVIFTNSFPVPLAPGRYYLGVFNNDFFPVRYTVVASEYTNPIPNVITLTNGVPYAAQDTAAGGADYYRFVVVSDAVRGQFEVNQPARPVALYLRRGFPPFPGPAVNDYASANPGTNDQLITVYDYSLPVPLTMGDWYLVVTNLGVGPVNYSIKATTWLVYGTPLNVTGSLGGTNGFCLTWNSLPGVHYVVEGRTDLATPGWFDASPTVTATDYWTTWCLAPVLPYQFFRVTEGFSTNAATAAPP